MACSSPPRSITDRSAAPTWSRSSSDDCEAARDLPNHRGTDAERGGDDEVDAVLEEDRHIRLDADNVTRHEQQGFLLIAGCFPQADLDDAPLGLAWNGPAHHHAVENFVRNAVRDRHRIEDAKLLIDRQV